MNELESLLTGAGLAAVGGYVGDEIRSMRERSRERAAIKVSIADELRDIEATIGNLHQVWESAQLFHPSYISDLLASTSAYDNLRPRMFLLKDKDLRKEIGDFYKKLKDTAHKTEGKIGTLAQTPEATSEQASFDSSFQTLSSEAKTIRTKLGG